MGLLPVLQLLARLIPPSNEFIQILIFFFLNVHHNASVHFVFLINLTIVKLISFFLGVAQHD